jgi:tRNA(fMet)-specific endonuclease VapC
MLDTDTCIAVIKRRPEMALKKLRAKSIGQVGISSVTLSELTFGAANSARPQQNREALREFLLPLEVAAYDETCAFRYGTVRADLERKGRPIGSLDTLIAAHALALDAILVTHNTEEFGQVEDLAIEDWVAAAHPRARRGRSRR